MQKFAPPPLMLFEWKKNQLTIFFIFILQTINPKETNTFKTIKNKCGYYMFLATRQESKRWNITEKIFWKNIFVMIVSVSGADLEKVTYKSLLKAPLYFHQNSLPKTLKHKKCIPYAAHPPSLCMVELGEYIQLFSKYISVADFP